MLKVGKKIYFTVDGYDTQTWLTRKEARDNKDPEGLLIEVPLSLVAQKKLQGLVQQGYDAAGILD